MGAEYLNAAGIPRYRWYVDRTAKRAGNQWAPSPSSGVSARELFMVRRRTPPRKRPSRVSQAVKAAHNTQKLPNATKWRVVKAGLKKLRGD